MKKITLMMVILLTTIATQSQNKLLSDVREYFDSDSMTWKKTSGSNYKYDNSNNLIEEQGFYFNENGVWEDDGKTVFTYNANNKVTEKLFYAWSEITNKYEVDERTTYKYVNNTLTEILDQEWIGSSWVDESKYIVTYNPNNLPQTITASEWDGTKWVSEERTTFTYNANNKLASDVMEEWAGSLWVNSRKALYTYNSNNKLITVKGADWDEFNNNWKADSKNVFEYVLDVTGNRISSKESDYDTAYTYDTTQLLSSFAHPFKDKTGFDYFTEDFPYVNKLLSKTENGEIGRITYNYNASISLSTNTIEKALETIVVYPNPTSDFLNIQNKSNTVINKLIVTDLNGKKVLEQNSATQVNVQNLAKGMYLIEVLVGNKKQTAKFIKD